jgi:RNA polymerase sigma-70 factor (ECF subfamily)
MGLLCRTAATRIRLRPVNTTLRQAIHSTMAAGIHDPVMQGIAAELPRLWRYGLVLSGNRDTAEELVQATCVRAIERAHQFQPGTRLDRWLIAILHSIWLNEIRSRKVRQGQGLVDADAVLVFDGMKETETNILAAQVLREVQGLPEVQRETVYLVYVEGLTYREAAETLAIPIGTVMSRLAAARAKLAGLGTEAKAAATHPRQARE